MGGGRGYSNDTTLHRKQKAVRSNLYPRLLGMYWHTRCHSISSMPSTPNQRYILFGAESIPWNRWFDLLLMHSYSHHTLFSVSLFMTITFHLCLQLLLLFYYYYYINNPRDFPESRKIIPPCINKLVV